MNTFVLVVWMALASGVFAQPVSLSVSQTWSDASSVTFALNPRGPDGLPVKASGVVVAASAGGRQLTASAVQSFVQSGEGVAYLFLVDISKSLPPAQFEEVRKAMENFASGLRKVDRLAVLSFGDEVRVELDFTAEQQKIADTLAALKPNGSQTKLHLALSRALEMGQRKDAGLPLRKAIVVLTDGKDEGSGLNFDDLVASIRNAGLPVYSIGWSALPEAEKKKYFEELRRLAANSGGDFFEASASPTESYETIRQSVTGVLLAKFACGACPRTGKPETWELAMKVGEKVLTASAVVALPPAESYTVGTGAPPPQPAAKPWPIYLLAVGVGVGVLALAGMILVKRRRPPEKAVEDGGQATLAPAECEGSLSSIEPPSEPVEPVPALLLRLVVMRGMSRGSAHDISLQQTAVVGRDAGCELALSKEITLAPKQFELSLSEGRIVIRDVSGKDNTTVNGVPIHGVRPIEEGDVIGVGGAEFRLLIPGL